MDDKKFMVCVKCITYNHSKYIGDALNGFCLQKTDFPFVCVVIDDCSLDGEQKLLKEFIEKECDDSTLMIENTNDYSLHFVSHKANNNCFFAFYFLKYNHFSIDKTTREYTQRWSSQSKYFAYCEGDDYWISSSKLQQQVEFMEEHPDYNMIYTNYKENVNGELKTGSFHLLEGMCLKDYLLRKGFIPTASVLHRSSFVFSMDYMKLKLPMNDVPTWIQLMHNSPVKLLQDITTVYRILPESASHSADPIKNIYFVEKAIEVRKYFSDCYGYKDVSQILGKELAKYKKLLKLYKGEYLSFLLSRPHNIFFVKTTLQYIKYSTCNKLSIK